MMKAMLCMVLVGATHAAGGCNSDKALCRVRGKNSPFKADGAECCYGGKSQETGECIQKGKCGKSPDHECCAVVAAGATSYSTDKSFEKTATARAQYSGKTGKQILDNDLYARANAAKKTECDACKKNAIRKFGSRQPGALKHFCQSVCPDGEFDFFLFKSTSTSLRGKTTAGGCNSDKALCRVRGKNSPFKADGAECCYGGKSQETGECIQKGKCGKSPDHECCAVVAAGATSYSTDKSFEKTATARAQYSGKTGKQILDADMGKVDPIKAKQDQCDACKKDKSRMYGGNPHAIKANCAWICD